MPSNIVDTNRQKDLTEHEGKLKHRSLHRVKKMWAVHELSG